MKNLSQLVGYLYFAPATDPPLTPPYQAEGRGPTPGALPFAVPGTCPGTGPANYAGPPCKGAGTMAGTDCLSAPPFLFAPTLRGGAPLPGAAWLLVEMRDDAPRLMAVGCRIAAPADRFADCSLPGRPDGHRSDDAPLWRRPSVTTPLSRPFVAPGGRRGSPSLLTVPGGLLLPGEAVETIHPASRARG